MLPAVLPARLVALRVRRQFLACAASRRKWSCPGFLLQVRDWSRRDRDQPDRLLRGGAPAGMARDDAAADNADRQPVMRVGFTASKKVGNAVARNRSRRRLKALADRILTVEAAPGCDYVLVARTATPDLPFDQLVRDLRRALARTGARRSESPP